MNTAKVNFAFNIYVRIFVKFIGKIAYARAARYSSYYVVCRSSGRLVVSCNV
ncbi:MAG: hypothetical protein AB8Y66_00555 [Coxiella-like endosymbiont]